MAIIQALYQLQELEAALRKSKADLAEVASGIDHNEGVVRAQERAAKGKQALSKLQVEQGGLDLDVQETTDRLKELERRLYSGSTAASKDLLTLQHEIQVLQEKQSALEDSLLAKMEEVEAAQKAVADIEADLAAAEATWQHELPVLEREQQRLQQHLEDVAQTYQRAEASVDAADLKTYRSLQASKGQAIARVERGMCGGCAIAVPSHELQKVRTSAEPVRCGNCGRFLYAAG